MKATENKNITEEQILEWANRINNGGGNSFTPLSKGFQYALAKWVLAHSGQTAEEQGKVQEVDKVEENKTTPEEAKPIDDCEGIATASINEADPKKVLMNRRRVEELQTRGYDAQGAFDEFLKWCEDHPKSGTVMDFSNGTLQPAAAFAYWLQQFITVEVCL